MTAAILTIVPPCRPARYEQMAGRVDRRWRVVRPPRDPSDPRGRVAWRRPDGAWSHNEGDAVCGEFPVRRAP